MVVTQHRTGTRNRLVVFAGSVVTTDHRSKFILTRWYIRPDQIRNYKILNWLVAGIKPGGSHSIPRASKGGGWRKIVRMVEGICWWSDQCLPENIVMRQGAECSRWSVGRQHQRQGRRLPRSLQHPDAHAHRVATRNLLVRSFRYWTHFAIRNIVIMSPFQSTARL